MTTKENIFDQHLENQDWLKRLDFYKEEIVILKERLEEVTGKNNAPEFLKDVEHYQNQFIIQRNNIDEIAHIITLDEIEIQNEVKANPVAVDHRKVGDQSEHRDLVTTFEKNFTKLRAEYNLFSSKWM